MPSAEPGPSTWVEGERVFGPPLGTYDADWVASAAHAAGVEGAVARELAAQAWVLLRAGTAPAELAGALGHGDDGVRVAAAAVELCALYGVDLPPQG